jgi:UDP-N-acetylmuramate--alanine ligase
MAVAAELRASGAEVSFLGTRERIEAELAPAAGYEIDFVKVRGIDRGNPLRATAAAVEALGAVGAARRAIRRRRADVVLGGGGFVTGPAGLGAVLSRTPLVLTEADSHLGLANRLLASRAKRVCLAFPIPGREGGRYLVTGRPVPAAVLRADRAAARERFGIPAEARCLLVMGGSQGARSINLAAIEAFAERGGRDFHVVHLAGRRDFDELDRRLGAARHRDRYTLLAYEPDLGDTLAAADLVLGRSGGSIFEVTAAGRPAILVPYPHATADHQSANAVWMEEAGAALTIRDEELSPERLEAEVGRLLGDEKRLGEMARASGSLARPDAARRIADEILAASSYPADGPKTGLYRSKSAHRRGVRERDRASRRLHFIGIGGAGMSGLALVCRELGATVTGSDRADSSYMERLRGAGVEPVIGHDAANLPEGAEVVVSTAIGEDNPELVLARERGATVTHRGELLAELCAEKRLIAVAGTHGKTTTTAMLVWALRAIGADPAFFVGGEVPGLGADADGAVANAGWGEGQWVIAEADESDASFLRLRPEIAVVTNIEMDHHTRWGSLAELHRAFQDFLAPVEGVAVPADGGLADLTAGKRTLDFDASAPGPAQLPLAVPGRHNLLNARAALTAVELAGLDVDAAGAALADFPGVRRRLELKGERNGARLYDDYAHHPTEVRAALTALRELDPERLIAVFQPHLYSRTKALGEEFGAALALADEVAVLDVYPAREEPVGELAGVSGLQIAQAAAERMGGRTVWWLPSAERAEVALGPRLSPGQILVTIGAGDVFELGEALVADGGQ